jgi:hypothetical protein
MVSLPLPSMPLLVWLLRHSAAEWDQGRPTMAAAPRHLVREACVLCYDRLHFGPWNRVDPRWRRAYALAMLMQAACHHQDQEYTEALYCLDMLLLMSGPHQPFNVDRVVAVVEARLKARDKNTFPLLSPSPPRPPPHRHRRPAVSATEETTATVESPGHSRKRLRPSSHETTMTTHHPSVRDDVVQRTTTAPCVSSSRKPGMIPIQRVAMPSLETFATEYLARSIPVIITGAMEHWPAMGKDGKGRGWSDLSYLERVAGRRLVPVELGSHYMDDQWEQSLMTLSQFIRAYLVTTTTTTGTAKDAVTIADDDVVADDLAAAGTTAKDDDGQDMLPPPCEQHATRGGAGDPPTGVVRNAPLKKRGYLAQHQLFDQIPSLRHDICVPDYCLLRDESRIDTTPTSPPRDPMVNAWFGPSGTLSPLHTDPYNNLFCQVVGSKYIRLIAPSHSSKVYPNEGIMNNTSRVLDIEDLYSSAEARQKAFPNFQEVPYFECTIHEGEMLLIPVGYWHYLRSLSVSFSVSFWWL